MDKAEAIAVQRELFAVCPEIGQAVSVSLDPDSRGLSLHYQIANEHFDSNLKDCVTKILNARKLEMIETKDLAIIYSPIGQA